MTDYQVPANYQSELARMAEEQAKKQRVTGGRAFSTRSGVLTFDDHALPGNMVIAVVLASVFEKNYYVGAYDPDKLESPVCYAISEEEDALSPHPGMQVDLSYFQPQHYQCAGCPKNEFGTAERGGGKACQDRQKLALIPGGFATPGQVHGQWNYSMIREEGPLRQAELGFLKLPPTSLSSWAKYVRSVNAEFNMPTLGVYTRIWVEPHPKHQFHIRFETLDKVDPSLFGLVLQRHKEALDALKPTVPYSAPEAGSAAAGAAATQQWR